MGNILIKVNKYGANMRLSVALCVLFIVSGCASRMPAPSISEYVKTDGGGFLFEKNVGIKYGMNYTLLSPSSSANSYRVTFDSTVPGGEPVFTEGDIDPNTTKLVIQSPVLPGVKNHQNYSVTLVLYVNGEELTRHDDQVRFSVDSNMLVLFGVKEY